MVFGIGCNPPKRPLGPSIDNPSARCQAMIRFYFAYGSNMNPARMAARGLHHDQCLAGTLPCKGLRFNKRAADRPGCAYANIVHAPDECVEGVLYRLHDPAAIARMDSFEGTPRLYSREAFWVETAAGRVAAWVYVANPAVLADGLLPEAWYLQHLLAGRDFLSPAYLARLQAQPVLPVTEPAW